MVKRIVRGGSWLCFIFCWTALTAMSQELKGKVTDATGYPIPGAIITLTQGSQRLVAISGKDGQYALTAARGTYDLTVRLPGFQPVEQTGIAIGSGGLQRDFKLIPSQYEELTVVSASKVETKLLDAPATVSVLTSSQIENSAADDLGDLIRTVPGVNIIQLSARDINVVNRQDTSTLSNTQLTLLDGRTIYQDFFGMVLWDFVPTDMSEIKQIEVIRGPASAVWGANAQTGVVNIITKPPREILGTTVALTGGTFKRDAEPGLGSGTSQSISLVHAGLLSDRLAFKVSAGYYESDPWPRPTGAIPADPVRGTGGNPYPPFSNQGTEQPKIDLRLDQELSNGGGLTYGLGVAGTEGIIHSGIGPFDIQSGSRLSYAKVNYQKGALKLNFFANILDGEATNLLTRGVDGNPIVFLFENQTYDIEVGHSLVVGEHHLLSYGGNIRKNQFDLSLAPLEDERDEIGAYLQDEITLEPFRFVLGARVDKFDVIDDPVFSPRITLMYQPSEGHTLRASYNQAFRSPSMVNNFLDVTIIAAVLDFGLLNPQLAGQMFPIISQATGNQNLKEDSLEAYEISYTGAIGNGLLGIAVYRNDSDDNINFTNPPDGVYTSENPPPGWPLPTILLDALAGLGVVFPSLFTYLNLGPLRYEGIEFSFDYTLNPHWNFSFNYSYQDDPEILNDPDPFPQGDLSLPPTHRGNLGVSLDYNRFRGSLAVNYTDNAFWTDVLDSRFHGPTDDFTLVNLNVGYRWMDGKIQTNLKVSNLFDEEIQQHIFGDIMQRQIVGELKFQF